MFWINALLPLEAACTSEVSVLPTGLCGSETKAKLMSFSRTQTRVAIGFLTSHNTLRRHLHILGLADSPLCRKCGEAEETSAHILCECEALASLRHTYLGSFLLEPEDIQSISRGHLELQ